MMKIGRFIVLHLASLFLVASCSKNNFSCNSQSRSGYFISEMHYEPKLIGSQYFDNLIFFEITYTKKSNKTDAIVIPVNSRYMAIIPENNNMNFLLNNKCDCVDLLGNNYLLLSGVYDNEINFVVQREKILETIPVNQKVEIYKSMISNVNVETYRLSIKDYNYMFQGSALGIDILTSGRDSVDVKVLRGLE